MILLQNGKIVFLKLVCIASMGDAVDLVRDNVSHVLSRFQTSPMHFYLGFSGGVDSTSLLDAVCSYLKQHTQHQLSLIHINHGLHDDADAWEAHCAGVARQYRLHCNSSVLDTSQA